VKKLYMCGASTHPGGGVSGGGRAMTQVLMEDLGIDFKKVVGR
jgi:phytoene dehydrogenase-like protein